MESQANISLAANAANWSRAGFGACLVATNVGPRNGNRLRLRIPQPERSTVPRGRGPRPPTRAEVAEHILERGRRARVYYRINPADGSICSGSLSHGSVEPYEGGKR